MSLPLRDTEDQGSLSRLSPLVPGPRGGRGHTCRTPPRACSVSSAIRTIRKVPGWHEVCVPSATEVAVLAVLVVRASLRAAVASPHFGAPVQWEDCSRSSREQEHASFYSPLSPDWEDHVSMTVKRWIVVDVQVQSGLCSFSCGLPKPSGAEADWWMDVSCPTSWQLCQRLVADKQGRRNVPSEAGQMYLSLSSTGLCFLILDWWPSWCSLAF